MSDAIDGLMSEINSIGAAEIGRISAEAVMTFWKSTEGLPRRLRRKLTEDFSMTISGYYVVSNQNNYDQGPVLETDDDDPEDEYS